jgi:hypothetical protein
MQGFALDSGAPSRACKLLFFADSRMISPFTPIDLSRASFQFGKVSRKLQEIVGEEDL